MPRTRILLADKNPSMLEILADVLGEEFEISGAVRSGLAAVEHCAELHPEILVVEIALEDMSGFDVAGKLQQLGEKVKIVYFSLFESPGFVDSGFAHGASAYVFKSRAGKDLLVAVRTVARGGRFYPGVNPNSKDASVNDH